MAYLYVFMPIIAGIGVSFQSAVNGRLGREVGTIESTYISFLTGTIFLTVVVLLFGQGNLLMITEVPFWQLLCAIFGIIFVLIMVFAVPIIGVTATTLTVIIGQLGAGMAIDHFGLFHQEISQFDMKRFFGVLCMIGAFYFIYKEKNGAKEV